MCVICVYVCWLQLVLAGELERGSELAAGTPEELGDLPCLAKVSGYLVVAKANHFSSLEPQCPDL